MIGFICCFSVILIVGMLIIFLPSNLIGIDIAKSKELLMSEDETSLSTLQTQEQLSQLPKSGLNNSNNEHSFPLESSDYAQAISLHPKIFVPLNIPHSQRIGDL